jgi:hypothetical protein
MFYKQIDREMKESSAHDRIICNQTKTRFIILLVLILIQCLDYLYLNLQCPFKSLCLALGKVSGSRLVIQHLLVVTVGVVKRDSMLEDSVGGG